MTPLGKFLIFHCHRFELFFHFHESRVLKKIRLETFFFLMNIRFFLDHVIGPHANHGDYFVNSIDMVFGIIALNWLVLRLPDVSEKQILRLLLLYGGVQFLLACDFIENAFHSGMFSTGG
jgi:hypothetical protein